MPVRETQLADLLMSLFPLPGELHRFLHGLDDGQELIDALANANTPLADVAHHAVLALRARGMLDVLFFTALLKARRRRTRDIVPIAKLWGEEIVFSATEEEWGQFLNLIPEDLV